MRLSPQTAPYSFSGFYFGLVFCWLIGFGFFPYSYAIDSIGDGEIKCGSRWTGRGFTTFWMLQEKNVGNCGFLKSLQLYSCCQAQELSPEERMGCMQAFTLSISLSHSSNTGPFSTISNTIKISLLPHRTHKYVLIHTQEYFSWLWYQSYNQWHSKWGPLLFIPNSFSLYSASSQAGSYMLNLCKQMLFWQILLSALLWQRIHA